MNLLIVDDEFYSVEGIARKIEGAGLGFARVFRAYSLAQAQEILTAQDIGVLITDIEMPKGSGLELVAWVREKALSIVCVFLTSFANFEYANTAIRLQSFDYLLKPVEEGQLIECARRAMERARQLDDENLQKQEARRWRYARPQLAEQFLADVALGAIPGDRTLILTELSRRNLPASLAEAGHFPVLLRYLVHYEEAAWDRNLYEFALKNILAEVLFEEGDAPVIARVADAYFLISLSRKASRADVLAQCEQALAACVRFLPGRFGFFVRDACAIEGLRETVQDLLSFARNQLDTKNRVEDLSLARREKRDAGQVPAQHWGELLLARRMEDLREEARGYLSALLRDDAADRNDLVRFLHDFMQITYSALDKSGTSAHRLFDNRTSAMPLEQACDSVEHMKAWVEQVLDDYQGCMAVAQQSAGAVEEVCAYIKAHLDEELTRDRLATAVYLSPDYLSHVFREKKGVSLTAYIAGQRIQQAKELLLSSGLSVRDVALRCGFSNISYFAKQFKRATGKTPQAYRKAR